MSESPVEMTEEEARKREQELVEDTRNEYQKLRANQEEALAEIAKGESLEQYETVQMGELEIEVKAWVPGNSTDELGRAVGVMQSGQIEKIGESMGTFVSILSTLTVDETYDEAFWSAFYEEWGPKGILRAFETVGGPARESMEELQPRDVDEEKMGAVDGFRTNERGEIVRSGNGDD